MLLMNYTSHNARGETLKGRQLEDVDFTSDTVFLGVDAVLTSLLPSLLPSLHLLNIPLITLTLSPTPPPLSVCCCALPVSSLSSSCTVSPCHSPLFLLYGISCFLLFSSLWKTPPPSCLGWRRGTPINMGSVLWLSRLYQVCQVCVCAVTGKLTPCWLQTGRKEEGPGANMAPLWVPFITSCRPLTILANGLFEGHWC